MARNVKQNKKKVTLRAPAPDNKSGNELLKKLRPGIDGVIISKGMARATFLPQVWEQLPATEDFLAHLCRKAGLSSDEWKKAEMGVSTYQVQYFHEQS